MFRSYIATFATGLLVASLAPSVLHAQSAGYRAVSLEGPEPSKAPRSGAKIEACYAGGGTLAQEAETGDLLVELVTPDGRRFVGRLAPAADPADLQAPARLELRACDSSPGTVSVSSERRSLDDRGRFYLGTFAGGNWPWGRAMNNDYDPSFLLGGQIEYALTDALRLGLQGGHHAFPSEPLLGLDNQTVLHASAVVRLRATLGSYHPYASLGAGAYTSKVLGTGYRWDPGVQVGAGLEVPMTPTVDLVSGGALHMVRRPGAGDLLWVEGHIGFLFPTP